MKFKAIISTILIAIIMFGINNVKAYEINAKDIHAGKGKEFNVEINLDTDTCIANGTMKFDSSKLEFVKCNDSKMTTNLSADGQLEWLYLDMENDNGTRKFEFTFKVKKAGKTEINLEKFDCIDLSGNEYTKDTISGSKVIKVNDSNIMKIVITAIVIIIILAIIVKFKQKKQK